MTWIDIVIIIIFLYNLIMGYSNGFIRSLFGFLALIGAFILAPLGKGICFIVISSYMKLDKFILENIAMSLSWICIYILITIIGTVIFKLVSKTPLKIVDKLIGLLLGLFISIIIVNIPLIFIDSFKINNLPQVKQSISSSKLIPIIKPSRVVLEFTFKGVINYWKIWIKQPDNKINNNIKIK